MAKGTVPRPQPDTEPRVRRGYFECRFGQLHVHNAIPPGGGFEEGAPLLCVHSALSSGRIFHDFLALAGRDRSVYAPDLPGFDESDPPPAPRPSIADHAAALGDFLDTMRFRQIDVLGYQAGALVAAELAIARPQQVRRAVLMSVPVPRDGERELLRRTPAIAPPTEDGSHLLAEWRRASETYGGTVSLEVRARLFAARLRNALPGSEMLAAAQQYEVRRRLSQLTQPILVLRPKDDFWDATQRVRELLPKARIAELPDQGNAVLETAPAAVLGPVKEFLRG